MTSTRALIPIVAAVMILGLAGMLRAGDVATRSAPPTVDEEDQANIVAADERAKFFPGPKSESLLGQTFTTGNAPGGYLLKGFSLQVDKASTPEVPERVYTIRAVKVSGNDTRELAKADGLIQTGPWSDDDWFTWTFDKPVELLPNMLYGVDVTMTKAGNWQLGLPYMLFTKSDTFRGGCLYHRSKADPEAIKPDANADRVIHVDLEENDPVPPGTLIYRD